MKTPAKLGAERATALITAFSQDDEWSEDILFSLLEELETDAAEEGWSVVVNVLFALMAMLNGALGAFNDGDIPDTLSGMAMMLHGNLE